MPHADPEARQAYNREYKRRNRWRYRARQKVYDAAKHANERARRYGATGQITAQEAEIVLAAGRCFYCDTETPDGPWTIDHREPLHAGGPNAPDNLVCCCQPCNISKHRADRPGRWGRHHDACAQCGTNERPHVARGLCGACYQRAASARGRT